MHIDFVGIFSYGIPPDLLGYLHMEFRQKCYKNPYVFPFCVASVNCLNQTKAGLNRAHIRLGSHYQNISSFKTCTECQLKIMNILPKKMFIKIPALC